MFRRQLGAGGMGVVYEAFDVEREARVALKTLQRVSPDALYRFKQEFRSVQELEHPNLVRLGELICADGQWFFTMEFLEGVDLLEFVRAPRTLDAATCSSLHAQPTARLNAESPPATATTVLGVPRFAATQATANIRPPRAGADDSSAQADDLGAAVRHGFDEARLRHALRQLALGLHALHEANKVHRDVKPSNVVVTAEQRVVLLDFGILADAGRGALDSSTPGRPGVDVTAHVSGTPAYVAPEQLDGDISPASDWYSLGVVLYEALVGQRPYRGGVERVLL